MAEHSPDRRDIQAMSETTMAALAWAGMALVLGPYFLLSKTSALPGLLSLLVCIGTALIIAYGAHGGVGRILTWRPVVWIGLISYSLYLVHWPVYVYISYRLPDMPSLPLRLAMCPISFALAAGSYYFIEQPFRHPTPKDKRWGNTPFILATLAIASLLMGLSAYYKLVASKRVPPQITSLQVDTQKVTQVRQLLVPYPQTAPVYQIFRYVSGQPDAPKLLVLGDSHGGHLRTGLQKIVAPSGIDVDLAQVTGCPPLFDITIQRETDTGPDASCIGANAALKALVASPDYDAVVLTSRWGLAVGDRDMPSKRLRHIDYVTIGDRAPELNMEHTRVLFTAALAKTVAAIRATGKSVILLTQVPPVGTDLNQCQHLFPWALDSALDPGARCMPLSYAEKVKRAAFADSQILPYTDQPSTMVVNSLQMMCPEGVCVTNAPQSTEPLYLDDNHLNETGSVYYLHQIVTRTDFLGFVRASATARAAAKAETRGIAGTADH